MFFLSWWAGFFGNPPGMLGGAQSIESSNSVLETALNRHGGKQPLETCLAAFSEIPPEIVHAEWLQEIVLEAKDFRSNEIKEGIRK